MFTIALAFCAGAAALHALPALLPIAALPVPALAAVLLARHAPAAAACLAGFFWAHLLATFWLASGWPCSRDREELELTGRVTTPAIERAGRIDFELDDIRSPSNGALPRRVRLSWYDATALPRPGECWRMAVRLRCRHGMANSGAADRELELLRQRIDATGYVAGKSQPERIARASMRPVEGLRSRIAEAIAGAVPAGPSVAVLQGLSVGVRGSVPDALWEAFAVTGVAHLMAISGLHVTGCALFVLLLLRLLWRIPPFAHIHARLPIEAVVVIASTAAYALLAGASLPALRTLATVIAVAGLRIMRRTLPAHEILALVAVLLVATDPLALASAGFWLSVVATAALLTVLERGTGWRGRVTTFARAQAAVSGLLAPILAASFGRVSLIAPAANAVAIPFFTVVLLPAVLIATGLELAWQGSSASLWRAQAMLLDSLWPWLASVAAWRVSSWAPAAQAPALIAGACIAALAALLLPLRGIRAAAVSMLAAVAFGGASRPAPGAWTLTVVDVGQGLAAVVETARHVLVFDTGARWHGGGTAARVSLVPYLRSRGVRRIDLLIISHDDMDHAGGVETLGESFRVERTMTEALSSVAADRTCRQGQAWRWNGIEFRVLHPPLGFAGDGNDRSCALVVGGPGGTALLLADAEAAAEAAMLAGPIAADVVLLPHHGSRSSSTPALVTAVGARLGIASAGFGNRWGMPAREVVARWRAAGTTVLTTAESGAVTVRFPARPGALEFATVRSDARHWWRAPAD